jgi:hypothetical protein
MSLVDLYRQQKEEFANKKIFQIIGFAGGGELKDSSVASSEFRNYLSIVPSSKIKEYGTECLMDGFKNSGMALQDIVNEMGKRIGFKVTQGRYKGIRSEPGFDGIWEAKNGHKIIIEVKTTDAYRINLDVISKYRKELVRRNETTDDLSSILIIVGRQDTGDLEAQVRGSKHAWDVRILSIDALHKLMDVKEILEDPKTADKIFDILVPKEYTRIDEIIDLIFSTAEDVSQQEEDLIPDVEPEEGAPTGKKFTPVNFTNACIERIKAKLKIELVKKSRASFFNDIENVGLVCAISKLHGKGNKPVYWFAYHPHQKEYLKEYKHSYVAYGCGSEKLLFLFPIKDFEKHLPKFHKTELENRSYWHVQIMKDGNDWVLITKKEFENISVAKYLV